MEITLIIWETVGITPVHFQVRENILQPVTFILPYWVILLFVSFNLIMKQSRIWNLHPCKFSIGINGKTISHTANICGDIHYCFIR